MSNSIQQIRRSSSCSLVTLALLVMMAVLAVYVTSVHADGDGMSGGEGGEMTAMADAIKYLQGLDKVYGQAARPRSISKKSTLPSSSSRSLYSTSVGSSSHGDRGGLGGKIVRLLQLKQLDRRYDNTLVRPRFGKRGRYPYFDLEDLPAAVRPQHVY